MRIAYPILLLVVLILASCSTEPEIVPITRVVTQISQFEVTKVVEITREVNVTRLVQNAITATSTATPPAPDTPMATSAAAEIEETANQTPTATTFCRPSPPADWALYTIKEGDSLSKYATENNITIRRIQQVNCLNGIVIRAGNELWLPITPTPTPLPSPTPLPGGPPAEPPPDSSSDPPKPPPKPTPTPP